MQWEYIFGLIIGNMAIIFPLFLWNRSEANADRRDAARDRKDILQLIHAIQDEIKDFHYRLLQIERDRK